METSDALAQLKRKVAIDRVVRRARSIRDNRIMWLTFWEELARYFYPERRGFIATLPPGSELQEDIWTSSPQLDAERLADTIDDWCRPHGQYWIGLAPEETQLASVPEVRVWCKGVAEAMTQIVYHPEARFIQRSGEFTRDLVTFGTAVMLIYYDAAGKHLVFKVPHMKNVAFAEGGRQQVTEAYTFWEWTLEQLVDEMGLDALPEEIRKDWEEKKVSGDQTYCIIHAVFPKLMGERFGLERKKSLTGAMTEYASLWILEKQQHVLQDSGFFEIPYVVSRWRTVTHEPYGRGPCMTALNDARTANAVAAALVEITEKQGNPPIQYPIDALRGEIELFPGGATPYDLSGYQFQGDPIRPVKLGTDAPLTDKFLEALETRIGKALYRDLIDLPDATHKFTQDEIQGRMQQSLMHAAPVFSKVQEQSNSPILDRVFNIAMRLGAFPPPPDVLRGKNLRWRYDTMISQMREAAEASTIAKAIGTTMQLPALQAATQENLDGDLTVRRLWRSLGVPEILIKPMETVIQLREKQAQMQQAQQMAEMANKAAPALKAGGDLAQSGALSKLMPPQSSAQGQG